MYVCIYVGIACITEAQYAYVYGMYVCIDVYTYVLRVQARPRYHMHGMYV